MKNFIILINKMYIHRYFILFIMLFSYAQSIYSRISVIDEINIYTFTPEAFLFAPIQTGILFLIITAIIKIWQKSEMIKSGELAKIFGVTLIIYPLTMQLLGFIIAYLFNNVEQNFNPNVFLKTTFMFFLDGFIYGGFILTYYYFNKSKNHQKQLTNYQQALSENKIQQLKSQLNPHFLFNNLNVLDQLINENQAQASDFLNEFADIYRYVLQTSDKELVDLSNEINFAKQYFRLYEYKYGKAYQLALDIVNSNGLIVPLTLQLLIENAIQHNLGTAEDPIRINIKIHNSIIVTNSIQLKKNNILNSGKALANLKEQYHLLTLNNIEISSTDSEFKVVIPKI